MSRRENIFEAVATGDARQIIVVVDPDFNRAVAEASARAHARGIAVYDGRASQEASSKPTANGEEAVA